MEGKAYATCFDPVLHLLGGLFDKENWWYQHLESPVEMMRLELTFLKMFFRGLAYWEDLEYDWHMLFARNSMIPKFTKLAKEFEVDYGRALDQRQSMNWDAMVYELEEAIFEFKPHVKDICFRLLGGAFKCTSCPSNQKGFLEYARETASFIELVQQNLRDLQESNLIAPRVRQYIALILGKLEGCGTYVDPVILSINKVKNMCGLISHARDWCNRIACLTYLYLVEGKDENLTASMEILFVGLLHRNVPFSTSGVISSNSQRTMIPQLLGCHFDVLLEDLAIPMKDDVQEGLLFLLSFIMDPPEDDSEDREMIFTQICSIINEFPRLTHSSQSGEMKEGIYNVNSSDFKMKVKRVKDKVKRLYVTPLIAQLHPPFTNPIGFLDTTIRNVKEMLQPEVNIIPSLRHQGEFLLDELDLLKRVERNATELLEDEIHNLWTSVISTVYRADYIIKLILLRRPGSYLWYGIVYVLGVIEEIQSIRIELNKLVGVDKSDNKIKYPHDHYQIDALLQQGAISAIEKDFTGFMEIEREIIDELRREQKSLQIISISGSGGQGKTTLANRIYNNSNVQYHFQKRVWCYVSKDCPVKEILVHILRCDTNNGSMWKSLEVDDLVELVWKSFKGMRYLVVMDDIWDSDSWHKLKSAFPDDKKGSRILFTSRSHDLGGSSSISHPLPLFSDEESWELIRKKVVGFDNGDEEFVEIDKKIASYCKGLPLAVVLIAGVLRRTEKDLNSWNQVAENLKVHLAGEGCGNVIKTSYMYLPNHLKPCFLYFGAFERGDKVRAKLLKLLWIGEGFIVQDRETKSTKEDLASGYLEDLASQGLVMVTDRNSMGEIKRCTVHDLLYDLCLERCKKDGFFNWAEDSSIYGYGDGNVHKYNHHRLQIGAIDNFIKPNSVVTKRGLPTSPLHSFLWLGNYGSESSFRFIESFKFISVLNLHGGVNTFPRVILSCTFLRFLALRYLRKDVPPEIANLRKLETLIIRFIFDPFLTGKPTWLPVCMWNMKSLRHLDIRETFGCLLPVLKKNSGSLIGDASTIETLGLIWLGEIDSTTAEFLGRFPNLRKLSCETTGNFMELLRMVGSLLPHLESLKVRHRYKLPSVEKSCHFGNIGNLKKLSLHGTEIPWRVLSEILKQLPNLQVLKLLYKSCVGLSWNLEHGDFPKLKYLKLSSLDFEEIDVSSCENDPFPVLEYLVLESCVNLREIPCVFEEISTLKTIKVFRCRKEVEDSAMWISEQQRDYGNRSFQVIL